MSLQIGRYAALVVGLVLPCIEAWRRWNMLSNVPAWLDDFIVGGLLLYGYHYGRPYLMAAWGYTFGMAYVSFFGQFQVQTPDPSGVPQAGVLAFKGSGMVLALTCLALAWREPRGAPACEPTR